MSGNTWGRLFTVTSFGESHGPAIGCVVDGCPPGLELTEEELQIDLDRRRPGRSRYTSQRRETDRARVLSGLFEGRTTGTPIAILIDNEDARSRDYDAIKDKFRPGHADFTYWQKYGLRDHRGSGRASARETASRVAAGAIARKYLAQHYGVEIYGYLSQMGPISLDWDGFDRGQIDENDFFWPSKKGVAELRQALDQIRRDGDSLGARVEVIAAGVPAGWGEPVFDRLDAEIAASLMSINAVKGVEIGAGFGVVAMRGSQCRDELTLEDGFVTNNAGGILGGISSGQEIRAALAVKPTSSILVPGRTLDTAGRPAEVVTKGRHDPCVGIRAVPIAEAMLAIVLMDHALRDRGQTGQSHQGRTAKPPRTKVR